MRPRPHQVCLADMTPFARTGARAILEAAGIGISEDSNVSCFLGLAFPTGVLPVSIREAPIGVILDQGGDPQDPHSLSDLETHLAESAFDDTAHLNRARALMARMASAGIGSRKPGAAASDLPSAPYVLVIDEGQETNDFNEMLVFAQTEHLGATIVVYCEDGVERRTLPDHIQFAPDDASPWQLFPGALGVYAHSGATGFLAIFAEHRPRIFGQPFYASWGLTADETPVPRRQRTLTRAQLFAACIIDYPIWYDRFRAEICGPERAFDQIEAELAVIRRDRHPYQATGFSMWKRRDVDAFFGQAHPISFGTADEPGRTTLVWGMRDRAREDVVRVEDGFLRSRGLGAALVPPLSLVTDSTGLYYDASRPSDLEALIAASLDLSEHEIARTETLIARINRLGLSKYNLTGETPPALPMGHKILVPGQVEDDASIRYGCDAVHTNLDLLKATRAANPDAVILYKLHPDVQAGLRPGGPRPNEIAAQADMTVAGDIAPLLDQIDEVWTMTSLTGFEALLRGVRVTCLGVPFYAGWGLTRDLGVAQLRRQARPSLAQLAHATLIDYARYLDPLTGLICPVEVAIERLADPTLPVSRRNGVLARLQRVLPYRVRRWSKEE